jgi:hypothetical protein
MISGRLTSFLVGVALSCAAGSTVEGSKSLPDPDRLFDQYGLIRWADEQARLDNFAIQLLNNPDDIGYIFVYDGKDVCEGEAHARAIRARKYVVEHRKVSWNRVMWRYDGYAGEFSIVLQPASRTIHVEYPFLGPFRYVPPKQHVTRHCGARFKRIENSKPGGF